MKNFNPNKIWFKETATRDAVDGEIVVCVELFYKTKVYHMSCVKNHPVEIENIKAQFKARFLERVKQGDV